MATSAREETSKKDSGLAIEVGVGSTPRAPTATGEIVSIDEFMAIPHRGVLMTRRKQSRVFSQMLVSGPHPTLFRSEGFRDFRSR